MASAIHFLLFYVFPRFSFGLIVIRQHSPGYIREDFDITPKMSTYLVAFMVTDLIKTNPTKSNKIDPELPNINIWSRKEAADMTQ